MQKFKDQKPELIEECRRTIARLQADHPVPAEDRAALWNAAEVAEKCKDARVARDYEVAIPKEVSRAQGIELVRGFSAELVDRYGVAVDFNVHRDEMRKWDGSQEGWPGYHAHVLTSTRKLGRAGFGDKAEPELSDASARVWLWATAPPRSPALQRGSTRLYPALRGLT